MHVVRLILTCRCSKNEMEQCRHALMVKTCIKLKTVRMCESPVKVQSYCFAKSLLILKCLAPISYLTCFQLPPLPVHCTSLEEEINYVNVHDRHRNEVSVKNFGIEYRTFVMCQLSQM